MEHMNANNTFRIMDKDGNVLKTGALNSTYNLPNMSIARTIEIWLNPTGCQAYASKTIDYINFYKSVDGNNYTSFNLEYKGVKIEQVVWMQNKYINTKNTFNKDVALKGYQMPGSGIISVNADYFVSDYMPVLPSDVIYGVGGQTISSVVLYDANKARITAVQPNFASVGYVSRITLSSYANIAYIRISDLMANINTLCIAKSPIYKYEPYNALDLSVVSKVNNAMLNFWEGKNGDSLGDSITGQNYFQKYTKQYFNLAKFSNHGIGGTTLSGNANANGDSMWMDSRINALDVDADFITVLGGQNDGVVAIGSLTLENYDTNTYAGALNVLISKLLYKYAKNVGYYTNVNYSSVAQITTAKDVIIILCTPFYVPSESEPYRLKNMANAVREIAKLWGLNVCDLSNKSGLNYGVSNIYWSTDRTHPLEAGHRDRITPVLIGVMEQIKPIDFTKCSYI
jgi:hypothetical protein